MDQLGILAAVALKREQSPLPTYEYVWDKLEGPGLAIIVILILLNVHLFQPPERDATVLYYVVKAGETMGKGRAGGEEAKGGGLSVHFCEKQQRQGRRLCRFFRISSLLLLFFFVHHEGDTHKVG